MTNFSGKNLHAGTGGPQGGGMDSRSNGVAEVNPRYLAEAASHSTPVGFKQTEIGVTPEDWSVDRVSEVVKDHRLPSGIYKDKRLYGTGTKIIKLGDVFNFDIFSPECAQRVQLSENEIRAYNVEVGDIFLALASVKLEGVGKVMLVKELDEPTAYDHNVALIRVTAAMRSDYLAYLFKSEYVRKLVAQNATQVGTSFLKASTILGFVIPLPSIKEQAAIANALSDVDALISELEKLIAKKQAIKTATMQQLLTGRTRLPQFALREDGTLTNSSGTNLDAGTGGPKGEGQDDLRKGTKPSELGEIPEDWKVKTYGEVFTFLSTSTNSRADLSEDGDFGYVHYGDIHTEWNNKLDLNKERLPRISKNIVSSAFVMDGDLIMADASEDYEGIGKTVEVFNVGDKQLVAGLHTFLLRDKEKVLADGFRGYLHSIPAVKSSFDRLATGMKVYGISKNNLSSVCIPVPSLEEQTAIATILSDMDAEIQALEQRLGKTRQIKQGTMQELLTGKTRLIKPSKEVIHE